MLWCQNIRLNLPQNAIITVIPPCPRLKSCLSWYFFMILGIDVWSTSIRKRSASICVTSFPKSFLITVLLNWKKKWPSHKPCSSRSFFWANARVSVLLTALPYVYARTRESIFIKRSREYHKEENVLWAGSSDSNCIWYVTNVENF